MDTGTEGSVSAARLTLVPLLLAVLVCGVAWALVTPAWQAPDEDAHFAYVQSLVERRALPGEPGRLYASSEQQLAMQATLVGSVVGRGSARPPWSVSAELEWRLADGALGASARADGGGPSQLSGNPPLYYLSAALGYVGAGGAGIFGRLLAMRLVSLAWLLVTVVGAWLLAGEVFGRDRPAQLATGAVAGLLPMVTFVSASVNADAALFALWTLALWLGLRALNGEASPGAVWALSGVASLALLTKLTSLALLPGLVLVLAVALVRGRRLGWRRRALTVAGPLVALGAPLVAWQAAAASVDRSTTQQLGAAAGEGTQPMEFLSYLWQFYLPRLPGQADLVAGLPVYSTWVQGTWGSFGWLEVRFPAPVYVVLAATSAAVLGAAGVALARRGLPRLAPMLFVAAVVGALLAGLHWVDYRLSAVSTVAFMQGRYLLVLVGLFGLGTAAALRLLPARARALGLGVLLAGLCTLQGLALLETAARFFA